MTKKIKMLFNSHKIKYLELENEFKDIINDKTLKTKQAHIFIDFNLVIQKYMYSLGYFDKNDKKNVYEDGIIFISEFLNLVTHYKMFFYKYFNSKTYIYITLNKKMFGKDNELIKNILDILNPIIDMIPEVNILTYSNEYELCYLKYHLIYRINYLSNREKRFNLFIDLSKNKYERLFYLITKNIYFIKFESYKPCIISFKDFRNIMLKNVDNIYVNSVISFIPLIEALNKIQITDRAKIDDIILKYIKNNIDKDFNDIKVRLVVLKMFSENRKVYREFKNIEHNIKSIKYKELIENIIRNWRNKIFDKNIYRVNEIFKIDKEHQLEIEKLLSC